MKNLRHRHDPRVFASLALATLLVSVLYFTTAELLIGGLSAVGVLLWAAGTTAILLLLGAPYWTTGGFAAIRKAAPLSRVGLVVSITLLANAAGVASTSGNSDWFFGLDDDASWVLALWVAPFVFAGLLARRWAPFPVLLVLLLSLTVGLPLQDHDCTGDPCATPASLGIFLPSPLFS